MWQTLVIIAVMLCTLFVVSHFLEKAHKRRLEASEDAGREALPEGDAPGEGDSSRIGELIEQLGSLDPAVVREATDALLAVGPGALPRLYNALARVAAGRPAGTDIPWTVNLSEAIANFGPRVVGDLISAWPGERGPVGPEGVPPLRLAEIRNIASRIGEAAIRPAVDDLPRFERLDALPHLAAILRAVGQPCHGSLKRALRDHPESAAAIVPVMVETGALAMNGLSSAETAADDAVGHALAHARALWERLLARDQAPTGDDERPADVRDLVSTIARGDDTTPRLDLALQLTRTGNREALVPLIHLIEADTTLRSSFELRVEMASAFGASLLDVMTLDYIRTSPSGPMRTWAIALLGEVGTPEAVDRLISVIETMESDDEAIEAAEFALERVPNFAARLVDALTNPKTHVVASAARVLRFRREATALEPLLALSTTLLDPFPALDLARDLGPAVAPVVRAYWDGNPAAELEWRVEDLLRGWGVALDDGAANRPGSPTET